MEEERGHEVYRSAGLPADLYSTGLAQEKKKYKKKKKKKKTKNY